MLPNRYEYAGCNPSNYVDPSGLSHSVVHQCAKGAVRGGVVGIGVGAVGTALGIAFWGVATAATGGVPLQLFSEQYLWVSLAQLQIVVLGHTITMPKARHSSNTVRSSNPDQEGT